MAAHMSIRLLRTSNFNNKLVTQTFHKIITHNTIQKCNFSQIALRNQRCLNGRIFQQLPTKSVHLRLAVPLSSSFIRNNSSTPSGNVLEAASSFIPPPDYIPLAPPIPEPVSAVTDIAQSLNALGEPTLQSLGLGTFWPAGLVQQALEGIHVGLGIPWWGSIVIGTLIVRLCLFPIVIKTQKMSIHLMNHMPTVQNLQAQFTDARQRGNMMEATKYGGELGDYMKKNNVKPFNQLMMPLFQLPIFFSVFVGLRGMANLPLESMKTGGCLWFPDLTIAQPFYLLPLMTSATFLLTIEAGVDGMGTQSQTHTMKWFLRAMPLFMLPVISNFPTAMLVYWFTSNIFSLSQVMFLKIPQVREFFNIPKKLEQKPMLLKKQGFIDGFKESWSNMKAAQKVAERQKVDETNLRKAAQGPIVKTYSYNPKEVKAIQSKPGGNKNKIQS